MKTSIILAHAKKYLARDYDDVRAGHKEDYICFAIRQASQRAQWYSHETSQRVMSLVQRRLAPFVTLEDWLEGYHGVQVLNCLFTRSQEVEYIDKLQLTRHAWIDAMIAEFLAMGD